MVASGEIPSDGGELAPMRIVASSTPSPSPAQSSMRAALATAGKTPHAGAASYAASATWSSKKPKPSQNEPGSSSAKCCSQPHSRYGKTQTRTIGEERACCWPCSALSKIVRN